MWGGFYPDHLIGACHPFLEKIVLVRVFAPYGSNDFSIRLSSVEEKGILRLGHMTIEDATYGPNLHLRHWSDPHIWGLRTNDSNIDPGRV